MESDLSRDELIRRLEELKPEIGKLLLQQGAHDPDWAPLEDTLLGDFMFMGYAQGIRMYKHAQTRRYLNLDPQGRAYRYVGETDRYEPIPLHAAAAHAFS